jgi:hypothetical protein
MAVKSPHPWCFGTDPAWKNPDSPVLKESKTKGNTIHQIKFNFASLMRQPPNP